LALFRQKSPDLALLIERWDALTKAVRGRIMAFVRLALAKQPGEQ
jgi:hypothetical protein